MNTQTAQLVLMTAHTLALARNPMVSREQRIRLLRLALIALQTVEDEIIHAIVNEY